MPVIIPLAQPLPNFTEIGSKRAKMSTKLNRELQFERRSWFGGPSFLKA